MNAFSASILYTTVVGILPQVCYAHEKNGLLLPPCRKRRLKLFFDYQLILVDSTEAQPGLNTTSDKEKQLHFTAACQTPTQKTHNVKVWSLRIFPENT